MANPNPTSRKGKPNKSSLMGRDLALLWGPDAIREMAALAGLVRNPDGTPAPGRSESDQVRLNALTELVNRAYGKPLNVVAGDEEGGPVRHAMNLVFVAPDGRRVPFVPRGAIEQDEDVIDA